MVLRKHQAQLCVMVDKVINGATWRIFRGYVTPGGGKSYLPIIIGKLIRAGLAEKLCWVVPRISLQYQGEGNFVDPFARKLLGHNLTIRSSTNDRDPCRGLDGFVTTYQAIGVDSEMSVLDEFARRRYILILDEFHHVEEQGTWYKAFAPLVDAAAYLLLMTGTIERGDKTQIAFMPYEPIHRTDLTVTMEPRLIEDGVNRAFTYTRAEALAERAIIPLRFYLHDGNARWKTKIGDKFDVMLRDAREDLAAAAVYTALHTTFAEELLKIGVDHWLGYKRKHRTSRLLVVCADINLAQRAREQLIKRGLQADIATSADTGAAKEAIRRFKDGRTHVLVGVAMFYEGFDCKPVSHIVSLTHIRSTPWIEQMVARAVRVDPDIPYDGQYGYVFAPDDIHFREIVARIRKEQAPTIRKDIGTGQIALFEEPERESGGGESDPMIIPIGSSLTRQRETVVGRPGQRMSHMPFVLDMSEPAPSDVEADLRKKIDQHVRDYARSAGYSPKRINRELFEHFLIARADMKIDELRKVKDHLKLNYRIDGCRRPAKRRRATAL